MAEFIPDDIDFGAYMAATDCQVKIRPASVFALDLDEEFAPRSGARHASMLSTKLRSAIEFRPGELTVWAGHNGARKSMFCGQLVLDLCRQNEPTLIVSLEMSPRQTLARMCRQACATDLPSAERRREFMRWTDGRLWLFDHVGRLTPAKCLAVCRYFASKLGGRHVLVDSFMRVCQSEEAMDEQKALIGDLCDMAKDTGLHVHLVAHCRKPTGGAEDKPPSKYDIKGSGAITDQSHNVLTIWQNRAKRAEADKREPDPKVMAGPDAVIAIEKQRNGRVEGKFAMWFDDRSLRFIDTPQTNPEPYRMED